jgi:hypothetical protein
VNNCGCVELNRNKNIKGKRRKGKRVTRMDGFVRFQRWFEAGLPGFSWLEKMYQMNTKCPNGHKMYQMAVKYSKWP